MSDRFDLSASERREQKLRARGAWRELVDVLLERLGHLDDPAHRAPVMLSFVDLYADELSDPESALAVAEAAFRDDYGNDEIAARIAELANATQAWDRLMSDYTEVVIALDRDDPPAAVGLWLRLAQWYGDHLEHLEWAVHSCEQALRLRPDDPAASAARDRFARKLRS